MNLKLKISIYFSACVIMRGIGKEIRRTEADVCKLGLSIDYKKKKN